MSASRRKALPDSWKWVRLGDVADRSRNQVESQSSIVRYVAGGHFDEGVAEVTRFGVPEDGGMGSTFRYLFEPGDVLMVSASMYLRKVAVATFTGVVADKTYVIRTRNDSVLRQDFIPHVLLSDDFYEYSMRRASGSMNARLLWKPLADYEFALPPLEEQKRLVELFAAVGETLEAYQQVLDVSLHGRIAQAHVTREPGDGIWRPARLGDLGAWFSGATPRATNAAYYGGDIPFVTIGDLTGEPVRGTQRSLTEEGAAQIGRLAPAGSVFLSMYGTIGKTGIAQVQVATNQAIAWLECDASVCLPEYVLAWLTARSGLFDAMGRGATQRNINREMIRSTPILLPPLEVQKQIVDALSHFRELEQAVGGAHLILKKLRSSVLNGQVGVTDVL